MVMTDFETWMLDEGRDRIFRMWELRTPGDWTPYEMERKFIDQSNYVNDVCEHIRIVEIIELPNKDLLIGYKIICDLEDFQGGESFEKSGIHYKNLSKMELAYYPDDMKEEYWM